ncbi:histidinol-phosphatase [Candidatus Stoquefichus massiliensis]|uniref:histidinol-phosphatase n=1 Tax=Candidatus Stoquefichus massiliensis TaxID=1470350 RepID=UPI000489CE89|nr:histidinol-phosphatase [Candidatus Stoquefichus massiliensis]
MKNYHTHTKRCYHAIDNEEEYVKAAIQSGYTELGFSDHTPWHYDSSFHSTMRMEEDKLDGYVNTLLKLREKYKNQISIKIGLECEYFPKYMDWLKQMLHDYPIDYIILGNHYDDTDETGIYFGRPLTKQQLTKYVDNCIKAIETGLYSYVAHPDLAYYDTDDEFYLQQMRRLCETAKKHHMPLEFNLLGYKTHRQYPNETFFRLAKTVGNKIIIGTDAHESDALLDMKTYHLAKQYIERLGLELTEEIHFLR